MPDLEIKGLGRAGSNQVHHITYRSYAFLDKNYFLLDFSIQNAFHFLQSSAKSIQISEAHSRAIGNLCNLNTVRGLGLRSKKAVNNRANLSEETRLIIILHFSTIVMKETRKGLNMEIH